MIVEEVARLTGTLKFNVDNRPLLAFEKKLVGVTNLLKQFGAAANKKFNIKVTLDAKSLREQLDKVTASKITFKNFSVSREALEIMSKKIADRLERTPIKLTHVKVDVAALIGQKRLLRTLLGQMTIDLPVGIRFKQAETMLRAWKTNTEQKFTLRLNADISQARFIANVRRTLRAAASKIGELRIKITDPKLKLTVDQANLRAQIRAAISAHEFDVRVRVRRGPGGDLGGGGGRGAGGGAVGGGIMGAGMGFMRGALPGLGAAYAFSQLNRISQQMVAQQNAMTATMGGEAEGAVQSKWVKDLSNKIGMDYRQVGPAYTKMLASGQTSGMSTESVQNIFQGVSEYGRVMGLDNESMKGSMKAIEQMMNKGQVMSEELKSQLAERMPGAMSAMAEAAGFGSDDNSVGKLMDAMKKGTVKSDKVLEQFGKILAARARKGGALVKAMQSTAAEQARFNNAFSDAVKIFSAAGFDRGMGQFFKSMAEGLVKAEPGIKTLGEAFEVLIEPVNAFIGVAGTLIEILPRVASLFGLTGAQLTALGVTAGLMMLPFGGVAAAIGAIALALDDLIGYAEGKESVFGEWLRVTPEAQVSMDNISGHFEEIKGLVDSISGGVDVLAKALEGLTFNEMMLNTMREIDSILNGIVALTTRITLATKFAATADGTADSSTMRFIKGFSKGPEYMWSALEEQGYKHDEPNLRNNGNFSPQDIAQLAEALRQAKTEDAIITPTPTVVFEAGALSIAVGGVVTPDDLISSLRTPMEQIAKDAFGSAVSNAMIGLKETK